MIRLPSGNLFAAASSLGGACKFMRIGRRAMIERGQTHLVIDLEQMGATIQAARFLRDAAHELGLGASERATDRFGEVLKRLPHATAQGLLLDERRLSELADSVEYLITAFGDELDGRHLFVGTLRSAELIDTADSPFGEAVLDAFPSSAADLSEAAHCLAAGRATATVMHLMRALEIPLALLADRCGVEQPGANWNTLLNRIEASIRDRSAPRDLAGQQWAAEAATHFRFIKNAWRNHAMHGRTTFTEQTAGEIYQSVGAFLQHLAGALAEGPAEGGAAK